MLDEAWAVYEWMQQEGLSPDRCKQNPGRTCCFVGGVGWLLARRLDARAQRGAAHHACLHLHRPPSSCDRSHHHHNHCRHCHTPMRRRRLLYSRLVSICAYSDRAHEAQRLRAPGGR